MSNKKTAVDFLIEGLKDFTIKGKSMDDITNGLTKLKEQAKQMEKEQIVKAFNEGDFQGVYQEITGEQYYTQTYESDNTQTYQAFKGELIKDQNGNLIPKK